MVTTQFDITLPSPLSQYFQIKHCRDISFLYFPQYSPALYTNHTNSCSEATEERGCAKMRPSRLAVVQIYRLKKTKQQNPPNSLVSVMGSSLNERKLSKSEQHTNSIQKVTLSRTLTTTF